MVLRIHDHVYRFRGNVEDTHGVATTLDPQRPMRQDLTLSATPTKCGERAALPQPYRIYIGPW
jgi:hypothetical protein